MAWEWGKRNAGKLYAAFVICAVIGLSIYALRIEGKGALPTQTFTADGSHLGDFKIGLTTETQGYYNIFQLIFGKNTDEGWVTPKNMFQHLLLPFFAIWLVMYGIAHEIGFFRTISWFDGVFALIVALITSSTGYTIRMMRGYLIMGGTMGTAFFGVVFVLGLGFWFVRRMAGFGMRLGASMPRVLEREAALDQIRSQLRYARDIATQISDETARQRINNEIRYAFEAINRSPPSLRIAQNRLNNIRRILDEQRISF